MNPLSWGETVTISLDEDDSVTVRSACRNPLQLFDWGQNKRNVDQFISLFSIRQIREAKCDFKQPVYLDDQGKTPVDRMIEDTESWAEKTEDKP